MNIYSSYIDLNRPRACVGVYMRGCVFDYMDRSMWVFVFNGVIIPHSAAHTQIRHESTESRTPTVTSQDPQLPLAHFSKTNISIIINCQHVALHGCHLAKSCLPVTPSSLKTNHHYYRYTIHICSITTQYNRIIIKVKLHILLDITKTVLIK